MANKNLSPWDLLDGQTNENDALQKYLDLQAAQDGEQSVRAPASSPSWTSLINPVLGVPPSLPQSVGGAPSIKSVSMRAPIGMGSPADSRARFDEQKSRANEFAPLSADAQSIAEQKAALEKYATGFKKKYDISAILPLVDSLSGMNLAQGYKAPETQEDHDVMVQKLRNSLIKDQGDYANRATQFIKSQDDSKNQLAMMRMMASTANAGTKSKNLELDKVSQQLEQMRGNPAVQQAERDIYAGEKAKSLITLYPDTNKLSTTETGLLRTELAKIASGGVPGLHELDALDPHTLTSKLGDVYSAFMNEPNQANAGKFIERYKSYLGALTGDARKVITDRYGRILNSRKRYLAPEDFQDLSDNYINRFQTMGFDGAAQPSADPLAAKRAQLKALRGQ